MVDELVSSLLLERDDDESDEDVDEEERKHDEVDDVEDGHLHAEVGLRTLVLVSRVHRVNQHPARSDKPHKTARAVDIQYSLRSSAPQYDTIEYFEYFCQMSSKSIIIILSRAASKLVRFLRQSV